MPPVNPPTYPGSPLAAETLGDHQTRIRRLEAAAPPEGCEVGEWVEPTLVNGWANAGAPFCDIAYRLTCISLDFRGHISGGADGTIAFYLDSDYWPECDKSTITDVVASPPSAAEIYISAADGSVTITATVT